MAEEMKTYEHYLPPRLNKEEDGTYKFTREWEKYGYEVVGQTTPPDHADPVDIKRRVRVEHKTSSVRYRIATPEEQAHAVPFTPPGGDSAYALAAADSEYRRLLKLETVSLKWVSPANFEISTIFLTRLPEQPEEIELPKVTQPVQDREGGLGIHTGSAGVEAIERDLLGGPDSDTMLTNIADDLMKAQEVVKSIPRATDAEVQEALALLRKTRNAALRVQRSMRAGESLGHVKTLSGVTQIRDGKTPDMIFFMHPGNSSEVEPATGELTLKRDVALESYARMAALTPELREVVKAHLKKVNNIKDAPKPEVQN
jgi:hypothetical protein